jgi:hypothetical protein
MPRLNLAVVTFVIFTALACDEGAGTDAAAADAVDSTGSESAQPIPIKTAEPVEPAVAVPASTQEVDAWILAAQAGITETCTAAEGLAASNALIELEKKGATEGLDKTKYDHMIDLHSRWLGCGRMEWRYEHEKDAMGEERHMATTTSRDKISMGFPYEGPQYGILMVRRSKGLDIMLSVDHGQFVCSYYGCSLEVKFDDGPTQKWQADEPESHSTTLLFLRQSSKFLKALAAAKVVRIKATFFQQGSYVFEFSGGIDTKKLDGKTE